MNATTTAKSSVSTKRAGSPKAAKRSQQSKAIEARWQNRTQTDQEVREYFLNCDHGEGLEKLQTLRRHVDIAARAYDENIHRDKGEKCANQTCRRQLGPNFPWYNKTPQKDPLTGGVHNVFTCSLACYVAVHGNTGPQPVSR